MPISETHVFQSALVCAEILDGQPQLLNNLSVFLTDQHAFVEVILALAIRVDSTFE